MHHRFKLSSNLIVSLLFGNELDISTGPHAASIVPIDGTFSNVCIVTKDDHRHIVQNATHGKNSPIPYLTFSRHPVRIADYRTMILHPCDVELTKVHYYDKNKVDRNFAISTISREIGDNNFNKNVIIKKNVFGHRWVLKLNEDAESTTKKSKVKVVVYVLVFSSLIVAICFGIFFSIERRLFKNHITVPQNATNRKDLPKIKDNTYLNLITKEEFSTISSITSSTNENHLFSADENTAIESPWIPPLCHRCLPSEEVCIKIKETEQPKCVKVRNGKDPTGCGGLCQINTHFCQVLNNKVKIYQCSKLRNILKCADNMFNCGNMCIAQRKRCDGVIDCSNRYDEENCECDLKTHFHCGNSTSCLKIDKKCDHKVDCWDRSDEENCSKLSNCSDDEISCYNGQCILKTNFCDGHFDCDDKTDEPDGCQI